MNDTDCLSNMLARMLVNPSKDGILYHLTEKLKNALLGDFDSIKDNIHLGEQPQFAGLDSCY